MQVARSNGHIAYIVPPVNPIHPRGQVRRGGGLETIFVRPPGPRCSSDLECGEGWRT